MKSPQSIKRQFIKHLKASKLVFHYDKQDGKLQIASMSITFNCDYGYVTAHVRSHCGYYGSIQIPYSSPENYLSRLLSIYDKWCDFNFNLMRVKYYKSNNKIIPNESVLENEIQFIHKRLSHAFRLSIS